MHSKLLSALLVAGSASLVSAVTTCTKDIKVTQPTPIISCEVVDASITVDSSVAGALSLEGPVNITGDIIISNASQLISISSSTIQNIKGNFELSGLDLLSTLNMAALKSLNQLTMQSLRQLSTFTFGTSGVSSASTILISDTVLTDLSGLNIKTVDSLTITNNKRLTAYNSDLTSITSLLSVTSNGNNMELNMTKLTTASEIQLSNVKTFVVPSLKTISQSLKFDTNPELVTFSAKNVTSIKNSVTFINNNQLTNVSFPLLTSIGDMTIQNNTKMLAVEGFPKLSTVAGGILLRGSFETVELPALSAVAGGCTVVSTTDISAFCGFFTNAHSKKIIQGTTTCQSNVKSANSGTGSGDSGSSGSGSGSSSSSGNGTDNAVAALSVNNVLLGVSVIAGMAQLW
ncbi:GPI-anchored cell wall organization protein [Trichoderma sp. SZMC 28014]